MVESPTLLETYYDPATSMVIIDGEWFPCLDFTEWERGGVWRIPLESGFFVEFFQGGNGKVTHPDDDSPPTVQLVWHNEEEPYAESLHEWPGVIIDRGQYVRQSIFSLASELEGVSSGVEVRHWVKEWSRPLEVVDSQAQRAMATGPDPSDAP